jgi:ectoine hydroxylase-related dioxygenase (phytanoyl-CoA dioxygenase family)
MTERHDLYAPICDIGEFARIVETPTVAADYPWCDHVELGAVVYDSVTLRAGLADPAAAVAIQRELADALLNGSGVVVLKEAFEAPVVDAVTEAFFEEIAFQHAHNMASGDHYAKPGANDRVWNALEKLAVRAPEAFVDYYANDMVALISRSWLGPNYQVSSQVNCVNPGGEAQRPHRDFHLGFMSEEEALQYPAHVHALSAALTLQGAVAHCDMPVETGPTLYLPHSQKYLPGYVAWRRPEFIEYFEANHMQLALAKGDTVFFNPALFHAAGTNRTSDVRRIANLLQISSSMGRLMESVDRNRMANAIYPALVARHAGGLAAARVANVIAATAEGYAFPTNLDRDPPLGGLTPPSEAHTLHRAVVEGWPEAHAAEALAAHAERRRTS